MASADYRPDPPAPDPALLDAGEDAELAPWNEPPEQRGLRVDAVLHGSRLDKAVVALAPEFSRTHLQGLIAAGCVQLDGVVVTTASRKVLAGQALAVTLLPTAESRAFRPEAIALTPVFEDAHLLVVDKPAGMVVHPAPGHWQGTLLNALLARHADAATLPRAGIVHRLDKDTSGLLLVGKTLAAVTALARMIAAREVHREYRAIADGRWPAGTTRIDAPIGRDPRSRVRMAVLASGRAARTDVERVAHAPGLAASAVRCTLHTGRTHQIRVHLAARGHALIGDALYGGREALGLTRQALHAARLAFAHPASGARLAFEAPAPADFSRAWDEVIAAAA